MNREEPLRPPQSDPTPGWGQSLATGAPGIALVRIEAAHRGLTGWDAVHLWAVAMTRTPVIADPEACGLFHGAPAVAFALHTARRLAYSRALGTLDASIAVLTRTRLQRANERIDQGRLPPMGEFDLISGLTGLGTYLLERRGGHELLHDILAYLVRLATEPLAVKGLLVPGWWTGDSPTGRPSADWPGGHANLGLAHGVAGPLALLALTARRGITVPGHFAAVDQICGLLDRLRSGTGQDCWWPETLTLADWRAGTGRQAGPGRPSWCYGTPGIARAQQLAALAIGDQRRRHLAECALVACLTDERRLSQLRDASLCHGWAGLVHIARRAAADALTPALAERLPALHARLEDHLNRHGTPAPGGLLEGPAGVELARQAPGTRWDACLLVAG